MIRGKDIREHWGCPRFGNYDADGGGHDWLDCPECLRGYEKFLEEAGEGVHE